MIKKIIWLTLVLGVWGLGYGQSIPGKWQWGLQAGTFHYLGDLSYQGQPDWYAYRNVSTAESPWALRARVGYRLAPAWSWQLSADYGHLLGADRAQNWDGSLQTDNPNRLRALNARTEMMSLQTGLRLHFANDALLDLDAGWDPYLEAGIGWNSFTPFGDLLDAAGESYHYWQDGSLRDRAEMAPDANEAILVERDRRYETRLSDLNTNQEQDYTRQTLIIPLGLGLRRRIAPGFWLTWSLRWQYTFSDYLDDANGAYPDPSDIPLENFAINPGNVSTSANLRGDPETRDSYFFTGLGFEIELGKIGRRFVAPAMYTADIESIPVSIPPAVPDQVAATKPPVTAATTAPAVPAIPVPQTQPDLPAKIAPATDTLLASVTIPILPDSVERVPLPILDSARDSLPAMPAVMIPSAHVPMPAADSTLITEGVVEAKEALSAPVAAPKVDSTLSAEVEVEIEEVIPAAVALPASDSVLSAEVAVEAKEALSAPVTMPRLDSTNRRPEAGTSPAPAIALDTMASAPSQNPNSAMADSLSALRRQLTALQASINSERLQREQAEKAALQARVDSLEKAMAREKDAEAQRQQAARIQEAEARVRAEDTYLRNKAIDDILAQTEVPPMPTQATPAPKDSVGRVDTLAQTLPRDSVGALLIDTLAIRPIDSISTAIDTTTRLKLQVGNTAPASDKGTSANVFPSPPVIRPRPAIRDTVVLRTEPALIIRDTIRVMVPSKPDTIEKIITVPSQTQPTLIGLAQTSVHFDLGKTTIHPADTVMLAQVLDILQARPELDLKLEGFTDKRGSAELNLRLSQARAAAVADFFIVRGIDSQRIQRYHVGESKTRYLDGALDRRVDISLIPRAAGK